MATRQSVSAVTDSYLFAEELFFSFLFTKDEIEFLKEFDTLVAIKHDELRLFLRFRVPKCLDENGLIKSVEF